MTVSLGEAYVVACLANTRGICWRSRFGRAGAQGEIEVNDFNRRQTDAGVLMLLKTLAVCGFRRNVPGLPRPSLSSAFGGN
jgi:hypothetical protein